MGPAQAFRRSSRGRRGLDGGGVFEAPQEHFKAVLWRINVDADDQGRGVGRFAVEKLLEEARERDVDRVNVIYEAGEGGPEAFFQRVGFTPVGETEYGEVIAEIRL